MLNFNGVKEADTAWYDDTRRRQGTNPSPLRLASHKVAAPGRKYALSAAVEKTQGLLL